MASLELYVPRLLRSTRLHAQIRSATCDKIVGLHFLAGVEMSDQGHQWFLMRFQEEMVLAI